jgi:hypothetical protein
MKPTMLATFVLCYVLSLTIWICLAAKQACS